jgi:acetoin utilization deacetylase AcuC-like enzyme
MKGHRRREFCPRPKNCKQQHYLWHKRMKRDADTLTDPFWKGAYSLLVEQYKRLELLLQARMVDLEKERMRSDTLEVHAEYYLRRYEDLQIDCVAKLKALGMSEQDIQDFETYWQAQTNHNP